MILWKSREDRDQGKIRYLKQLSYLLQLLHRFIQSDLGPLTDGLLKGLALGKVDHEIGR